MSRAKKTLRRTVAAIALSFALPFGCDSSGSGASGETHFLTCRVDRDCVALGSNYSCIARVCRLTQDGSTRFDVGVSNGGSGDGAEASSGFAGCPQNIPIAGARCSREGLACEYGDDPRGDSCRPVATCGSGAWTVDPKSCAALPTATACPATRDAAEGQTCSPSGAYCVYSPGLECWCGGDCGEPGGDYPGFPGSCQVKVWQCAQPHADSQCPPAKPNLGTACTVDGKKCGYEFYARCGQGDTTRVCNGGVWVAGSPQPCNVCASPDTPVATPDGERPIASLRAGDLVYSVDHDATVAVPVSRVNRTPTAAHRVIRVILTGGGVLEISAGHPTADGRRFGDLRPGSAIDEQHTVLSADLVPYEHDATYDILPASSTGTYFAAGVRIGSTLFVRTAP